MNVTAPCRSPGSKEEWRSADFARHRDDHGRPAVMGVEGDDPATLDDKPAQSKIATVDADLPAELDRADHRVGDALRLRRATGQRIVPISLRQSRHPALLLLDGGLEAIP